MSHIENPRDSTKTLLELINGFSKVAGKSNCKNLSHFCTLQMTYKKEKSGNQSIYNHIIRKKITGIKFNQGGKRPVH